MAAGLVVKGSTGIGRAVGINVDAIGRALDGFRSMATVRAAIVTTLSRWCWLAQPNRSTLYFLLSTFYFLPRAAAPPRELSFCRIVGSDGMAAYA